MLYNVSAEFAYSLDRRSLADRARSALFSSVPDAVLVSGAITGEAAAMSDLEAVKRALPDTPVLANTGVKHATVADVLRVADGCIVGLVAEDRRRHLEAGGPGARRRLHGPGTGGAMRERIAAWTRELMLVPGLSGHEDRVRRRIAAELGKLGVEHSTDVLGNLVATLPGRPGPSVMLIAHMDQLGFVVRRITPEGFLQVERVGGVPERALAAQEVLVALGEGRDLPAIIGNKSHHATEPEEKYRVLPWREIAIDAGFDSAAAARAAGVEIGAPVVYRPRAVELAGGRLAGTSVDDRAGCAVMLEVARALRAGAPAPTVHLAFSVQEEFNLRGVLPVVRALQPAVAIQLDLALATDTPDLASRGEVGLGAGPVISRLSFHGRGTLNGLIPHPALLGLFEAAAAEAGIAVQRATTVGALTETSYVQLEGVACIDLAFPVRFTHSAREVCDTGDLAALAALVLAGLARLPEASLDRDAWT